MLWLANFQIEYWDLDLRRQSIKIKWQSKWMTASCDLFAQNRKSCSLLLSVLTDSILLSLHQHPVCLSDFKYCKYPLKTLFLPCKLHNQMQSVYVSAKCMLKMCMQCANLLADGVVCSEEVRKLRKWPHQFFPIQFYRIEIFMLLLLLVTCF